MFRTRSRTVNARWDSLRKRWIAFAGRQLCEGYTKEELLKDVMASPWAKAFYRDNLGTIALAFPAFELALEERACGHPTMH